ncbi:sensor histidine kinase [Lacisediminihabitans sp. FW035]
MSLGLPSHRAPRTVSRSFGRSLNAVAYTCLAAALVTTIAFQLSLPAAVLWPALLAIGPMLVLLYLSARTRDTLYSIAYLVVGAACTYWFVLTFYSQSPAILESDALSLALPKIALIMVGGSAPHIVPRIAWCTAGYLAAEVSAGAAIFVTGQRWEFDVTTFLAYAVTSIIFIAGSLSRRSSRRTQPKLHRAARDEQLAAMRHRIEVKAASLLHDTVLSHLAAIADSVDDALDPQLRAQVERDLEILIGEEWLTEAEPEIDPALRQRWEQTPLFAAIAESQLLGLEIDSTGDFEAVSRLDAETARSLGLAVKQCLVNVLRHSGLARAEVAVFESETDVSVMVIDAGRGFTEAETAPDRLGIRHSIRDRIEQVGGAVQIWSTPGRGTSIMIRVPSRSSQRSAGVDAS